MCRLTSYLSTDEIRDREIGTQMTTGHRDIGNIHDDRDTQRESDRDTRNVRLGITINKAPEHK